MTNRLWQRLSSLIFLLTLFLLLFTTSNIENLREFWLNLNIAPYLPILGIIASGLIALSNAYRIMSLMRNIKDKFQGNKKIEAQICKNEQIDAIQNLTISNIENRLTIIEEKLKNANM